MTQYALPSSPAANETDPRADGWRAELTQIARTLAESASGTLTPPLTVAERTALEARRDVLKRLLGEASATEAQSPVGGQATQRQPRTPAPVRYASTTRKHPDGTTEEFRLALPANRTCGGPMAEVQRLRDELAAENRKLEHLRARATAAGLVLSTTPGRTAQYLSPDGKVVTLNGKPAAGYAVPA